VVTGDGKKNGKNGEEYRMGRVHKRKDAKLCRRIEKTELK
jgi:hypothetical protein